jgi:hypothetical protein
MKLVTDNKNGKVAQVATRTLMVDSQMVNFALRGEFIGNSARRWSISAMAIHAEAIHG